MERVHSFCAGPCTLPISVIEELAHELPDFGASGMSLIEMSHRDPVYDEVHHDTMALLRELCAHATRSDRIYRHRWQAGDLLLWDNASVLHAATYTDPRHRRTLHRITLAGTPTH